MLDELDFSYFYLKESTKKTYIQNNPVHLKREKDCSVIIYSF